MPTATEWLDLPVKMDPGIGRAIKGCLEGEFLGSEKRVQGYVPRHFCLLWGYTGDKIGGKD